MQVKTEIVKTRFNIDNLKARAKSWKWWVGITGAVVYSVVAFTLMAVIWLVSLPLILARSLAYKVEDLLHWTTENGPYPIKTFIAPWVNAHVQKVNDGVMPPSVIEKEWVSTLDQIEGEDDSVQVSVEVLSVEGEGAEPVVSTRVRKARKTKNRK